MSQRFCPKCGKTLEEINFYTHKDGSKCDQCKKCQTMHIDNYDPETFLWLLKDMDVPYIPQEWNVLRDKAAQKANADHKPLTGMSVYGKYLSKMKLKQWGQYGWEDTERLQAERELKMQSAAEAGQVVSQDHLKEMYEAGEISEAEYKTLSTEDVAQPPADYDYPENSPYQQVVLPAIELTEEDTIYLAMKWGRLYKPEQWVALEKLYTEMHKSFDIQGAAREDTVKKICKVSLQMDEAIDCRDTDTFQKLSRVYTTLMKDGKFTEAQNKEDGRGFVNSVGELVAIVEQTNGFIPRWNLEVPQDIVDRTIKDMNTYTYKLVTQDMGLGQQIEDALKNIQIQKEMEEMEEAYFADEQSDIEHDVLADADYAEFFGEINSQKDEDNGIIEEEE